MKASSNKKLLRASDATFSQVNSFKTNNYLMQIFPTNFTLDLMFIWFNNGARIQLNAVWCLIFSSGKPFEFNDEIWSLLAIFVNIFKLTEKLNNFACHDLQNEFYHGNKLNQTLKTSLTYFALLLILLLLLMLQVFCLNQNFLRH